MHITIRMVGTYFSTYWRAFTRGDSTFKLDLLH